MFILFIQAWIKFLPQNYIMDLLMYFELCWRKFHVLRKNKWYMTVLLNKLIKQICEWMDFLQLNPEKTEVTVASNKKD